MIYGVKLFFFVRNFDFGKRITLFRCYFTRNGFKQSSYAESVILSLNNVIKFIDELSCLRKVDSEIYITSWSRNSTDLGANLSKFLLRALTNC